MPAPLFASDRTAARLLDLPAAEFRRLVDAGVLPAPVRIGDHERWRVDHLAAIGDGKASLPVADDLEL